MAELRDLRFDHAIEFGGKAAALGEMLGRGLRVFDGVGVSRTLYVDSVRRGELDGLVDEFWGIAANDGARLGELTQAIEDGLARVDVSSLARTIVERLVEPDMADRASLLVRSSATVEDSADLSYAGQFISCRCMATEASVAGAIRAVWASCTTPHVRAYRTAFADRWGVSLDETPIEMGLVVQPHHDFDHGGLLFSQHPTVRVSGWMLLEYLDASPAMLVGGEVIPHRCRVSSSNRKVVWERRIANRPVLDDAALSSLVYGAAQLRDLFGVDVDIEWGVAASEPHFLQCRPATVAL